MEVYKRGEKYNLRFTDHTGERRVIATRTASKERADRLGEQVAKLLVFRKLNEPVDADTLQWIAKAKHSSPRLVEKIVQFDLIDRALACSDVVTLGGLIDQFKAEKSKAWKPRTLINYEQAATNLKDHFGESRDIATITPGKADGFVAYMKTDLKLAQNTYRKRVQIAKRLFLFAIRHKLADSNPFQDHSGSVRGNRERMQFIPGSTIKAVMKKAPDAEWRLILAMARWGGVRVPSELAGLTFADIDREQNRIIIRSPKTEHHAGKSFRTIPIFKELVKPIQDVYDTAAEGQIFCCPRCADPTVNLRTMFLKLIDRAGFDSWPKLWHNLRASRQTELAGAFPLHIVCDWLGNSQAIAMEHYLSVTDADFNRAGEWQSPDEKTVAKNVASKTLQDDANECAHEDLAYYLAVGCTVCGQIPPRGVEPLLPD